MITILTLIFVSILAYSFIGTMVVKYLIDKIGEPVEEIELFILFASYIFWPVVITIILASKMYDWFKDR